MAWMLPALMAAGAVKGGMDARANRKAAAEHDRFRRVAIANSPWSGMGDPGAYQGGNTNMVSGALGGGLQGGMVGSLLGNMGGLGALGASTAAKPQGIAMNTNPYVQQSPWNYIA